MFSQARVKNFLSTGGGVYLQADTPLEHTVTLGRPPPETAIAMDSMRPTETHSCFNNIYNEWNTTDM